MERLGGFDRILVEDFNERATLKHQLRRSIT